MIRRIVFVDVDTQFDFMSPRGALYVRGAEKLVGNLKKLTRCAQRRRIPIVSSLDAHAKNDPEFKRFPAHCVAGTAGQKKIVQTLGRNARQVFISKSKLDIFSNPRAQKIFAAFDEAYVYGVALEYCVKAACLGLAAQGLRTYLVTDATKAVDPKAGVQTKKILAAQGVRFITARRLVRRMLRCRKK